MAPKPGVLVPAILFSLLFAILLLAACIFCINPRLLFFWRQREEFYDEESIIVEKRPRKSSRPMRTGIPQPPPVPPSGYTASEDGIPVVEVHPDEEEGPEQIVEVRPDGTQIVEQLPGRGRTKGRK